MHFVVAILLLLNLTTGRQREYSVKANQPEITGVEIIQMKVPLFINRNNNLLFEAKFNLNTQTADLKKIIIHFADGSDLSSVAAISGIANNTLAGKTSLLKRISEIQCNYLARKGEHSIRLIFTPVKSASLSSSFSVKEIDLQFDQHKSLKTKIPSDFKYRPALVLRSKGQDNCDTYRIPGLITTNNGTLIAVYDNRYNNDKDLQEDIDIGMSRSTDGGQNWEPMKVIMDMDEYGGRPQNINGIGDPCILYDPQTSTIWVAALWMSGATEKDALWWASKPGMKPEETGQFILVKSITDGLTWSTLQNITPQIKNPEWQLLLQGPGRGITMSNGTLVFPAQFKADTGKKAFDGGQYTCHSTIVFSTTHGKTWQIGTGAKTNTTEAQVVELSDGSLMLNMRDDRNRKDKSETNGRAVAVTNNLGKTWIEHPSTNSALPEPNCMASLISAEIKLNGTNKKVLFFSNPDNKESRTNMTIKASLDDGMTWPAKFHTLLNETTGYGYSCLTMVDNRTIGIVYEGEKELYFQKIPVSEILSTK